MAPPEIPLPLPKGSHFEDLHPGQVMETTGHSVTEAAILAFAQAWDPQPFHLDRDTAAKGAFGGLVGSGLMTLAIGYRLFCDSGWLRGTVVAGLGLDSTRFIAPVRPGDTLRTRARVLEKADHPSRGRGRIRIGLEALNGEDRVVMTTELVILVQSRLAAPGPCPSP